MAQNLPKADEPVATVTASAAHRRIRWAAGLTAGIGLAVLGGVVASSRMSAPVTIQAESSVIDSEPEIAAVSPAPDVASPDAAPIEPEQRAEAPVAEPDSVTSEHWKSALTDAVPTSGEPDQAQSTEPTVPTEPQPSTAQVQTVPIPMPRPVELRGDTRRAARQTTRRVGAATPAPAPTEDTRSFFDKLFGIESSSAPASPALAYASLESTGSVGARPALPRAVPAPVAPVPAPQAGGGTAVYDISARTVTLPSGEKLEAHSGLGSAMDDPRYVHLRMRGPTPPGTYDLTEREEVFHGVRAIRMTPVGGSAAIHGRDGILAHTYMLGPNGASNGCVAFRDYDKFLQAHLRGEVVRLVVVTGTPQDALPSLVKRIFGTERTTKVGSAE